jgi:hypothetical protein
MYRSHPFESATSSDRVGGSSSLFHKVNIKVLTLFFLNIEYAIIGERVKCYCCLGIGEINAIFSFGFP